MDLYDLEVELESRDEDHEEIIDSIPTEYVASGETLYRQGDRPVEFSVVRFGKLEVAKHDPEGSKSILGIFTAGEPVGLLAVVNGFPYPATVQALENTVVYRVSADLIPLLRDRAPQWFADCLSRPADRFTDLAERFQSLSTQGLDSRLAAELCRLAEKFGKQDSGHVLIDTRMTRQSLSDIVGCRVESAIRVLSEWEQEGLIRTEESRITLLEPERIHSLAQVDR